MSFSDRSFMKFFYIVIAALIGLAALAIILANMLGGASREEAQYFRDLKDDTLLATAGNTIPLNDVVVTSAAAGGGGAVAEKSGEEVYTTACSACHMTGAAGAPKLEAAAWEARVAQGFDTLSSHAINGINAMPAKGGNAALSDSEVNKAVAYMMVQAGFESEVPAELLGGGEAAAETAPEESADTQADADASEAGASEVANQDGGESVDSTETVTDVAESGSAETSVAAEAETTPEDNAPAVESEASEVVETSEVADASALLAADLAVGQSTYNKACMACHMTGAAGAPKLEAAAWESRVAQGHDVLIDHAINGFNVMPAKGGNPTLSDDEVIAATAFMVDQTGLLK